jgi:putative ABC transport system permease protein
MDALRDVLRDLWSERRGLRAIVLVLALGTMGLTILLAFGEGSHVAMNGVLRNSSDRMLRYSAGTTSLPWRGLAAGRWIAPQWPDAQALRALPGARAVSTEYRVSADLRTEQRLVNAMLTGVEADYASIRGMNVRPGGRFLSQLDLDERRRVVCLGEQLARELFGATDPVGRTVRIRGLPFQVVGVVAERLMVMNYGGADERKPFVPATTAAATFGERFPSYVLVQVADADRHRDVDRAVRALLSARLGFDPADDRALRLADHIAISGRIRGILLGTRVFLFVMGALGLLVAALGVGNAMFARVEDKRREIGLRRALGATRRNILGAQILEALCVVGIGGGAGFALAAALLAGLAAAPFDARARGYLGDPVPSLATAAAVVAMLGLCALAAGLQPARAAASVPPVEALRHE